jgi:hypothetical protein
LPIDKEKDIILTVNSTTKQIGVYNAKTLTRVASFYNSTACGDLLGISPKKCSLENPISSRILNSVKYQVLLT